MTERACIASTSPAGSRKLDLRNRLTIVVLTHNRLRRVAQTIEELLALPERCALIVIDNGSQDDSAQHLRHCFPDISVVRLESNVGASARNIGALQAETPYVAFCDDDTWWSPGGLSRAVHVLDTHRTIGLLCARVLVGAELREDPASRLMADSPFADDVLPATRLLGFLAGACVVRRAAFLEAGGYQSVFFLGGEEDLLALDLAAHGWHLVYMPDLIVHHHPAPRTDMLQRAQLMRRNEVWTAWLRRPLPVAWAKTRRALVEAAQEGELLRFIAQVAAGAWWVARHRKPLPPAVEMMRRELDGQTTAVRERAAEN
jgi:GT2 family glycosyltransferase